MFAKLASGGGSPMMAAVAAGVALAPVLLTVGTGLGGLALAAYGAAKPIETAAQKTGGLRANMASLNPEQQKLATSILGLGKQYDAFSKSLQPQVLSIFGKGVQLAGNLMHDVQPVATATGKAIGTMLDRVDAEFQSKQWQNFFTWMGTQAGPDIRLLSDAFINLLGTLPGVLKAMQPVSVELLKEVNVATILTRDLSQLGDSTTSSGHAAAGAAKSHGILGDAIGNAVHQMIPELPLSQKIQGWLLKTGDAANHAAAGHKQMGDNAAAATPKVFNLNTAVAQLTASMNKNVTATLTLQGDELGWRQAIAAAETQLHSNSAGLAGNSANALANKQAVLAATDAAVTFASDQLKLHGNLRLASADLQDQIGWLQRTGDKSKFTRDEIHALRDEEAKIKAQLNTQINVTGAGTWSVAQGHAKRGAHLAGGARVPGYGGGDRWPALLEGGEAVVDKQTTAQHAAELRAWGVPGFAAGGVAGSYSGAANGAMGAWAVGMWDKSVNAIEASVAAATAAGIKAAAAAAAQQFAGGVSGNVRSYAGIVNSVLHILEGGGQRAGDVNIVLSQMSTESGGNPRAVNLSDINAQHGTPSVGLMQVIGPTFRSYAGPYRNTGPFMYGTSINPTANIYAALNYAIARYGLAWRSVLGHGHGYDDGGYLPVGASVAVNNTGSPEAVIPSKHLEHMIALLDELCGLVATNNQITAAAPTATGAGLGAVLGAHARKATYRAIYS